MRVLLTFLLCLLLGCEQIPRDTETLIRQAQQGDAASVRLLVERMGSAREQENARIYKALIALGPSVEAPILDELAGAVDENLEFRIAVLGSLRSQKALAPLTEILRDPVRPKRYVAAWALGEIGAPDVVPPLIDALSDANEQVRRSATRALVKQGETAVPALLRALKGDDLEGQAAVIRTLGDIRHPRALPLLLEAAKGENREAALLALGSFRDPRAEAVLVEYLTDPDWEVRLKAAMALGTAGTRKAVPYLEALLHDERYVVREWAARSLETITGLPRTYVNADGEAVQPYSLYH